MSCCWVERREGQGQSARPAPHWCPDRQTEIGSHADRQPGSKTGSQTDQDRAREESSNYCSNECSKSERDRERREQAKDRKGEGEGQRDRELSRMGARCQLCLAFLPLSQAACWAKQVPEVLLSLTPACAPASCTNLMVRADAPAPRTRGQVAGRENLYWRH